MFKNLLKVKGVKSLTKIEQKSVLGGQNQPIEDALRCTTDGRCATIPAGVSCHSGYCENSIGVRTWCEC